MRRLTFVLSIIFSLGIIVAPVLASSQVMITTQSANVVPAHDIFVQFKPNPQKSTRIDYGTWDSLVEEMVVYSGPSIRKRMSRPAAITGSRFVRGHSSAYRLEGNRIPYSQIADEFEGFISDYRKDLERIGTQVDIAKLSKNEQLAYWLNLHNVVMIEQLTKAYPLKRPRAEKIGKPKVLLHDAKIVKVKNTPLSLRDIREKIVYPNWRNPKVIYGFYLGDIGSPSIQNTAFTADNVSRLLDRNADEFVNSLRGFNVRNNKQYVSELYRDVAKFYFPNFDSDVATHMQKFMRDGVKVQMTSAPFYLDRYDKTIADMTGGQGVYKSASPLTSGSRTQQGISGPNTLRQYMNELIVKRQKLEEQGLIQRGIVIIEDIETSDGPYIPAPDIDSEP